MGQYLTVKYSPRHYNIMRKDRNTSGGGVMIGFKGDLVVTHRPDLDVDTEILWAQLEIAGSKPLLIGVFYRPQITKLPEHDYLMKLHESLGKIDHTKRQQLWLAGDFNLPGIHWPTQSTIPGGYKPGLSKEMINMVSDIGLEQMVIEPTRKGNILDLFLTTHPSLVEKSVVLPGMSDHDGIPSVVLSTKPRKIKQPPRKIYVFKRADSNSMKEDLKSLSNKIVEQADDSELTVENLWTEFKTGVTDSMNKHVPTKIVSSRNISPWMTQAQEIKSAHKRKQRAYNRFRKTKDPADEETFHNLRRDINKMTRKSRRRFVQRTCEASSKGFWSYIKSLKQESFGIYTLKDKGELISDNVQKAEVLNEQFRKVFTSED